MYEIGEAVVHPHRGAGIIVDIIERTMEDQTVSYYKIELLSKTSTSLMLPAERAAALGVRAAIPPEELPTIWKTLTSSPEALPKNSRTRFRQLKEKIEALDPVQTAEVVRDINRLREEDGTLKTRDKQIYQEAMMFLAGEVAATREIPLSQAESEIRERLRS
jgi:RNA polymerase-interacting CarD/CdnL/TRCF family regulator